MRKRLVGLLLALLAAALFMSAQVKAQSYGGTFSVPYWVAPPGDPIVHVVETREGLIVATRCCLYRVR